MPELSEVVDPELVPVRVSVTPGTGLALGFEQEETLPDMATAPIGVPVGVGEGVPFGDDVGVGVGADGPQGVNGPSETKNCVPPRAVSALLLPLAPEPAVVKALPRRPTRVEPIAIGA